MVKCFKEFFKCLKRPKKDVNEEELYVKVRQVGERKPLKQVFEKSNILTYHLNDKDNWNFR